MEILDLGAQLRSNSYPGRGIVIGRSADVDDVIRNFLGGILGYGCYVLLSRYLADTPWWNAMLTGDPLTPGATRLSLHTAA